jgi:hypothetical protein
LVQISNIFMVKLFNRTSIFDYSWDKVASAHWLKYCPDQDHTPHILHVDYLDRFVDSNGHLHTSRLLTCKQNIPEWLLKITNILGIDSFNSTLLVKEDSIVDPSNKSLIMKSTPLVLPEFAEFQEVCVYTKSPNSNNSTTLTQHVKISLCQRDNEDGFGFWKRMVQKVEEWCINRFEQNAERGRVALEEALLKLSNTLASEESPKIDSTPIISLKIDTDVINT